MRRPCPTVLNGCPGVDAPITNISAEAPDPLLFAAQVFDPYNPFAPPPLRDGPHVDVDCQATIGNLLSIYNPIIYAGTQIMANLQALAVQLGCPWPITGDQIYGNDEQTATVYCSDGSAFSYTVDANTMVSPPLDTVLGAAFVEFANAWALAYAFEQASDLLDCVVPGGDDTPPDPGPDKPTILTGPGILPGPVWMCFGEELFHRYTVSGRGSSSYDITISAGALPTGTTWTQDGPRTGYISGTPTVPGEYNFTIQAVSTLAPTITVSVQDYIFVMGITNGDTLPDAQSGVSYGPETLVGIGGTSPYTFASSDLPAGFSLSSSGVLTSDTTTVSGDYTFDVTITDDNGGECIQTCNISVVGCVLSCLPEKSIAIAAFSAPNVCTTDQLSGLVFAAQFIIGSAGTINRLNSSSTSIEATVVVDTLEGISDMVYHPSTGLIYVATTTSLSGHIYSVNPLLMTVVGSVAHSLGALRLAVDEENDRVYIGAVEPPPSLVCVVKSLDIHTMTISDVASGNTTGSPFVGYIPSTSSLATTTGLIASGATGNQLTLYRSSDFSIYGTEGLSNSIVGMDSGFDPVLDGALVYCYDSGGLFRIRALSIAPGFGEFTSAPFNAPAIGATIQIPIGTTSGLACVPTFFIGGVQWELESIDSGTLITVKNLSVVFGTLIAAGTFVFGTQVTGTPFFASQTEATSISYSPTIGAFLLSNTIKVFAIDRSTQALLCTYTPSVVASTRPERCDVSGSCNVVVPWNIGPVSDFYKVF